jgi:hypothetical protein
VRIARVLLLMTAVVACAWFALGIRQAHDIAATTAALSHPVPAGSASAHSISSWISAAEQLNPDRKPQILRGRLALAQGRLAQARAILLRVTHEEPQNLEPWIWFLQASRNSPAAFFASEAAIQSLIRPIRGQR